MVKRFVVVTVLLLALPSCEFVGPTAEPLSIISLSANPLAIGLNGEVSVVTVIVSQSDGNPPPNGTLVFLTTTLGTLPAQVETNNGRATASLVSGSQSGVATLEARSGTEVSNTVDVRVGTELQNIVVVATPATLPAAGGETVIKATALGDDAEPLVNVPIVFSTTAGSLQSGGAVVRTDAAGEATDRLTTTAAATVTATSGSTSGQASVSLAAANVPPVANFTFSPASPVVGELIFFNASTSTDSDGSIVSYEWDFGNGETGSGREITFIYNVAQTYVVTLTVRDDDGGPDGAGAMSSATEDSGFTLIVVLVAVAVTSILLSSAVTTWTHVMRRADEIELIWRGQQYAKAIECYIGLRAVPPTELEQLLEARCIRKLYPQPLSEDGSWRLVRAMAPGVVPVSGGGEDEAEEGLLRRNLRSSEPIVGVAPGITGTAIRAYKDSFDYEEWEFVFGEDERPPVRALGLPDDFRGERTLEDILRRQRERAGSRR